ESGNGVPFSALSSPTLSMQPSFSFGAIFNQVTVDQSGGPNDGNIYGASGERWSGFTPDGNPIPGLQGSGENACGIAPEPGGETVIARDRSGFHHLNLNGEEVEKTDYAGSPGLQPNTDRKWSERGGVCKPVFNNEGEMYGIKDAGGELG